jgi:hypothetical protein
VTEDKYIALKTAPNKQGLNPVEKPMLAINKHLREDVFMQRVKNFIVFVNLKK